MGTRADRRPTCRDPGGIAFGGEGRPVRGWQWQLPGRASSGGAGLGLSRPRRHRRHRHLCPGPQPRAGPGPSPPWHGCCWRRAILVTVAAGALALALPGAPLALLVLAHLYNIASEIMLWLVAAAWLPAPDAPPRHGLDISHHGPGWVHRRRRYRAPARLRRRGGTARRHAGFDALRRHVAGGQRPGVRPWRAGGSTLTDESRRPTPARPPPGAPCSPTRSGHRWARPRSCSPSSGS